MDVLEILGFIGVAGNFVGVWLIADGKQVAWIIWLFATGLMGTVAFIQNNWWPFALAAGYTLLNIRGLVKWIKRRHDGPNRR